MKIQYLAVLFVLIIVPISIVMASYIQNQIDAIAMQTQYDKCLISATYDAVKAFQLNTTNNKYSSISDSKIRDIEAAVNTFYNTLNTSMLDYSSSALDLRAYTPAILFTLYDGYYIYSTYDNVYDSTGETDEEGKVDIKLDGKDYQNGLRPYVYYSAKYKLPIPGNQNNVIVVNYTLDNEITVYGDVGDGNGYGTRSGYLINPGYARNINDSAKTLTYSGVTIEPEVLTEHLITIEDQDRGITREDDYRYIFYQNEKIYQDKNPDGSLRYNDDGTPMVFWYDNYIKTYVNDVNIRNYARDCGMKSTSAYDYYSEAADFSEWVIRYLGDIEQSDMLKVEDGVTPIGNDQEYLAENTGNTKIFAASETNDPMVSGSAFNNHRLAVIRKSIETNLNTIISNYHTTTLFDYAMPVLSDDDWYKILNNVSVVTFLQGMSIGFRYYNNYAVITNNINKEVVKPENVYIVVEDDSGNREYHQPGCKELLEKLNDGDVHLLEENTTTNPSDYIASGYPTSSFQMQSVKVSENAEEDQNFYFQSRGTGYVGEEITGKKTLTGCYNCIVNATPDYDVYDIMEGVDLIDYDNKVENGGTGQIAFRNTNSAYQAVRKAYLTALARERQDLYKTNFDLSNA